MVTGVAFPDVVLLIGKKLPDEILAPLGDEQAHPRVRLGPLLLFLTVAFPCE
jgi:hypothetical protein